MTTVKDGDNNGQGRQRQRSRTTMMVRTATARTMAMTARTTGKDGVKTTGEDDNVKDDDIVDNGDDGEDDR
jgi:hypothetical protein